MSALIGGTHPPNKPEETMREKLKVILKDLVDDLHNIDISCNFSEEEEKEAEQLYDKATNAILAVVREAVPEESQEVEDDDDERHPTIYNRAWNACREEMLRRVNDEKED